MRLATWNVNSLRVRLPQLLTWLDRNPQDLIALQELKLTDDEFPLAELEAAGWHALANGQKTYNGVAILSRDLPPIDVVRDIPGFDDVQRRVLAATYGEVRVIAVYVPNGQSLGSDKYLYKLKWLEALRVWLADELRAHPQLIVLGDYNIAPEDRDVHDPQLWAGSVHVSEPERAALRALLALGLEDLFRRFEQPPASFTWWDYRAGAFRLNRGLRIDLMLASKSLAERCTGSRIDREPRTWERPTDHAPVLATFASRPLMSNSASA
ncbi:MAG TPA: exodeoxyribonuclease III [Steroidobacteraceae bacterium]|nr:exodeoxyribonuclease III [Steroidobacteraceae bacterium]